MKKNIMLILIGLITSIFSQEIEVAKPFSEFKLGILAGINFSKLSGGSFIIEGKTNLLTNLNAKFSVGYSTINKEEGYEVKTNGFMSFDDFHKYTSVSYVVERINYDVFPVSIGFEYVFLQDKFSLYCILEGGYNYYTYHVQTSAGVVGLDGYYDTYDELPSENKNNPPVISEADSYRIALGFGTSYKLSSVLNLDIRYLYQFDNVITNTNQVLVGINF